jgi:DNA-binding NarL/FixJ family response regulator
MNEEVSPTRVLIADDDPDARVLLTEILEDEPSVQLVGTAKDAEEAVELAAALSADVAILDWRMPGGGGAYAAKQMKDGQPGIRIVALTAMDTTQASYDMMSAGADGFLGKDSSPQQIIDAIRSVTRW